MIADPLEQNGGSHVITNALLLLGGTNASGPYSNMPSATSPDTNDMTASPQRFFRLSQ